MQGDEKRDLLSTQNIEFEFDLVSAVTYYIWWVWIKSEQIVQRLEKMENLVAERTRESRYQWVRE
jgi:hypothetical protein